MHEGDQRNDQSRRTDGRAAPPRRPGRFTLADAGYLLLFWVVVGSVLYTAADLYPLLLGLLGLFGLFGL